MQKVFNLIGFTTPAIPVPKLILKETWKLELKWNEELSEDLNKQF